MDFLRRIGTEPQSAPAQLQLTSPQQNPIASKLAARTRDPNAPEHKYQVNQKCIYERQLPGGSYITAHLQRLQSGYYDTPIIHEDLIDNVRFVAINFVFHPSRTSFRFKSAEIRVALHNIFTDKSDPLKNVAKVITGKIPDDRRHSHATQTSQDRIDGSVVRYGDKPIPPKATRPKFLRHAPHLLYGAVSPETLDWNFNVAGSVGVSQGPASASLNPSGGLKGSYKLYEMMKIQGSVRTLRSWYGHQYDIEDGELVWTLEENRLQKSGLPREFTFVMLLTKGSSNIDDESVGDLTLDVDILPKVAGFLGQGSFPNFVTNLHRFQPYHYPPVNLDLEIGQVFEPCKKGRGFNFALLSSQFDDYVSLPGTTHSKSDEFMGPETGKSQDTSDQKQLTQGPSKQQPSQQTDGQRSLPAVDGNTLNLRVYLENARGSPAPLGAPMSYLHLRPPSRNPSPLPPTSVSGSQRSHKRTITITSRKPSQPQSRNISNTSAADRPRSYYDGQSHSQYGQPQERRQHSLRKTRSRSELNSEYNSSPVQEKSRLSTDFRTSPVPEQQELLHDSVTTDRAVQAEPNHERPARSRAALEEENSAMPQPDSQTLPQHEFVPRPTKFETPSAVRTTSDQKKSIINGEEALTEPPHVYSGNEGTSEWRTPPETQAELHPSPRLRERGSRIRSRPTSHVYSDTSTSREQRRDSQTDPSAVSASHVGQEHAWRPGVGSHINPLWGESGAPDAPAPDSEQPQEGHGAQQPFSYDPVREALNLALAEHATGAPPGSTPSHGFRGAYIPRNVSVPARKPVPTSVAAPTSSVQRAAPGMTAESPSAYTPRTALPQSPSTPPQSTNYTRDISTSSSMGEATGVWNNSPPNVTSPGIGPPHSTNTNRASSQRADTADESPVSNRAGVVWRKTRTIGNIYPAVEQADRYYRQRTHGRGERKQQTEEENFWYGDEEVAA